MIDFSALIIKFFANEGLKALLSFFKDNREQLQKAYENAYQRTIDWYLKKYGDRYGKK